MSDPSSRMLQLLSLLQTHRYWPGAELAGRLDVSARTLRRDVDRLRELGYPVDANRGLAGGYQLRAGAALPPLVLDDDEAVAIAVGLRTAAGGAVAGIEETSVRALAKVVQVMPKRLRHRVDALQGAVTPMLGGDGPTVESDVLVTIAQTCRDRERLAFDYTARDGEQTRRRVEPLQMVSVGRRWYLVAWDLDRDDWRSFRCDRIGGAEGRALRFTPRELPGGDPVAYVERSLRLAPQRYEVVIDVECPAEAAERFSQWADVEPRGDAACTMRVRADTLDWIPLMIGSLDADFTVREPAELSTYLRTLGERLLRSTA